MTIGATFFVAVTALSGCGSDGDSTSSDDSTETTVGGSKDAGPGDTGSKNSSDPITSEPGAPNSSGDATKESDTSGTDHGGSDSREGSAGGVTDVIPGKAPTKIPDPVDITGVKAFSTQNEPVERLFALWLSSDKAAATSERLAADSELDKLFEAPPTSGSKNNRCDDGRHETALCTFVNGEGDGGISLTVVKVSEGWKVVDIDRFYTDGTL